VPKLSGFCFAIHQSMCDNNFSSSSGHLFVLGHKQQLNSDLVIFRTDCKRLIRNPEKPQYINLKL